MSFQIICQDILDVKSDVIVNCTDEDLSLTGMLSSKIKEKAGEALAKACDLLRPCEIGKCVVTNGFNSGFKHIIHTVGPVPEMEDANHLLAGCYKESMKQANLLKATSVAFPLISAGGNGYSPEKALSVAIQRLCIEEKNYPHISIILALHNNDWLDMALKIHEKVSPRTPVPKDELKKIEKTPITTLICRGSSRLFLRRNDIKYIEDLVQLSANDLMEQFSIPYRVLRDIVEVLSSNNLYLKDYVISQYEGIDSYLEEKGREWLQIEIERKYQQNLRGCRLGSVSDLGLPSRYVTLLNRQNIFSVRELISKTRGDLLNGKQLGVKGVSLICDALKKQELLLKGDSTYTCRMCDEEFVGELDLDRYHLCPLCKAKKDRVSQIDSYAISVSQPEYSSYDGIPSGFTIYANIKNITDHLGKIKLKEFHIESKGKQISPRFYLKGYYFDEETIMPMSTRTSAKIWDCSDFSETQMSAGDFVYITLYDTAEKKNLMYKFKYTEEEMQIDDFFED